MTVSRTSMTIAAILAGGVSRVVLGQAYTPPQSPVFYTSPPVAVVPSVPLLNEEELEQLVGPVALYPDPLLGELLPAATYPSDVAAAAQFEQSYPNQAPDVLDAQPWEPSVRAIAHYPDVLQMMGTHLDWTAALGSAFLNQQQDVLGAVQQLRAKAQATGNLVSTPQQQVVMDSGAVDIVPVNNTVYVPVYDPNVIYAQQGTIVYGAGYSIGPWLDIDFDWARRGIWEGHRWDRPFDVHEDHSHERVWVRNFERPLPSVVMRPSEIQRPGAIVRPGTDPRRGYVQPVTPGAFGVQPRDQVERERARAEPGARPPTVVTPPVRAPEAHPAEPARPNVPPLIRPVQPAPQPVQPAPRPVQPARPSGSAFVPAPGAAAQSGRGHASLQR